MIGYSNITIHVRFYWIFPISIIWCQNLSNYSTMSNRIQNYCHLSIESCLALETGIEFDSNSSVKFFAHSLSFIYCRICLKNASSLRIEKYFEAYIVSEDRRVRQNAWLNLISSKLYSFFCDIWFTKNLIEWKVWNCCRIKRISILVKEKKKKWRKREQWHKEWVSA